MAIGRKRKTGFKHGSGELKESERELIRRFTDDEGAFYFIKRKADCRKYAAQKRDISE